MKVFGESGVLRRLAEAMHHGRRNVMQTLRAGEAIAVREEVTFQRGGLRIKIMDKRNIRMRDFQEIITLAQASLFNGPGNIEHVVAFWNDQKMNENIAAGDAVIHFPQFSGMIKRVFAGFQRLASVKLVPQEKPVLAANDTGLLQIGGN